MDDNPILNPLLELESSETDAFINTTNDNDIRKVLKKKNLDFGQVINQIGSKLPNEIVDEVVNYVAN